MRILKYLFGIGLALGIMLLIWLMYLYSQVRFDINKIIDYKPKLTTQFYDKNQKLIANVFDNEHRLYTQFDELPARAIEALVAIEDTQFFEHNGINTEAILRAIVKDIKSMRLVEGASTLTQQLVKTMILSREKKIIRKIKEILLSLRLETLLTKEEILERYFNQVYFGHGYYGIKTAAIGYFHKQLNQLTLKEIAMLVGLPRAPSFYDPTKNLKHALGRANQVIKRLNTLGWINEDEYNLAITEVPTIYKETLSLNKAPYIIDSALKILKKGVKDIKYGGYKVDLTIDLNAQSIAREALKFGYKKIIKRDKYNGTEKSNTATLNGAIVILENNTGRIIAQVGGVDYRKSSFNRATQSRRQPGSSIKPFLYQTALDLGYSTVSNLIDISRTYNYGQKEDLKTWQPKNYEKDFKGLIKFNEALIHSRNLATINLVTEMGIDILYNRLKYYGFEDIPFDLSITLGSFGISPLNLSEQYTIFSNQGIQNKPYLISSITDSNEQVITFESQSKYITTPGQAFLMTSILKDVVTRGTGRQAKVNGLETVGKTGTTNNNIDAWFCGYSPTIQTIVWYGNDDNKPMRRSETGGRSAAPVFSYFYKKWLKLHPEIQRKFEQPQEVFTSNINGKTEYFTNISDIPNENSKQTIQKKGEMKTPLPF
ncbi:MAG: PBP1A family penicillin-binding protein [Campylobacteraceae bacterium]|jgi:penicillin-binding protein 1A|nr:PBP1A family penicillin-binding protein [Campylobacteraceae bacterium]MBT3882550.1 PBP1A family penicillin-binding protein [Campylobacteraceae bacterium]MBT4030855.1 PBP1A family penicillin-binding protein [Campylobacteraceae bacterium]MBT4179085.1 PBP1A family penicillin-binding protein [Campylobacteraceae bacterium]MBT4572489.1 PBP1A family penicillin-binding protein [Campylobacteraceae bacterium]